MCKTEVAIVCVVVCFFFVGFLLEKVNVGNVFFNFEFVCAFLFVCSRVQKFISRK